MFIWLKLFHCSNIYITFIWVKRTLNWYVLERTKTCYHSLLEEKKIKIHIFRSVNKVCLRFVNDCREISELYLRSTYFHQMCYISARLTAHTALGLGCSSLPLDTKTSEVSHATPPTVYCRNAADSRLQTQRCSTCSVSKQICWR